MKIALFVIGLLFLILTEVLKLYFVMPFPHFGISDGLKISYFISKYLWQLRLMGFLIIILPLIKLFYKSRIWQKALLTVSIGLYLGVVYLFNFTFIADSIFPEQKEVSFDHRSLRAEGYDKLVVGVMYNGVAKAYPTYILGFHHQLKDTIGGKPVIVTYCSICREGKVYSPTINGKYTPFKLVGVYNFNSIFEDEVTGSWWQQATGKALTGELKGARLDEIPPQVMFMRQWLQIHPESLVLMPDNNYLNEYDEFSRGMLHVLYLRL